MARSRAIQTPKAPDIARSALSAPAAAPDKPRGWVERNARSDGSSWFNVALLTCSPFEDDPLVTIEIDRRHGSVVGEASRQYCDFIEGWRASDLDSLVEVLQDVIATARAGGIIPPSTGLPAWRQAHAKLAAVDERKAAS